MNQNKIFIQTQRTTLSNMKTTIREGCSVFVKILEKNTENTYTAFFAGLRFTVISEKKLIPGINFTATVSYKDGRVLLIPQTHLLRNILQEGEISYFLNLPNTQISAYLTSLGINPDIISLQLFQLLKQLGLKINVPLIKKSSGIASKFPSHEKEAAQIELLLEEKGIIPTEENIEFILDCFAGGKHSENKDTYTFTKKNIENEQCLISSLTKEWHLYFDKILHQKFSSKLGILTLFNHLGHQDFVKNSDKKQWLILPYELTKEQKTVITGSVKLLLDADLKRILQISIFAKKLLKKYYFVLFYKNKVLRKVYFSREPSPSKKTIGLMENKLKSLLQQLQNGEIQVEYTGSNTSIGFNVENEPVTVVRGNV